MQSTFATLLCAFLAPLAGCTGLSAQTSPYTYELPPAVRQLTQTLASVYGAPESTVDFFIREAIQLEQSHGLPAGAVLGIGILESGGFTSDLFQAARNPFGLKASAPWTGPVHYMWHEGDIQGFRVYADAAQAVQDFARLVQSRRWYADALQCPLANSTCFVQGLTPTGTEPGYSRDPQWGGKILDLIDRYDLDMLSNPWGEAGVSGER
jgi:flagellum-specific peptidoglycan hydrolase FlgJ